MMMKVDMFLNANYELRKNVMRGVAEYRMRTGYGFSYQDLTEGYQKLSQLGEQLLSLFEKPVGTPETNPDGGQWMTLKDISARLNMVYWVKER